MLSQIRVAILDDHQSIIDGFTYRLSMIPKIKIVGTAIYGENLEPMIAENEIDVLICDEAHRIRKTSDSMYTPGNLRTGEPQIDELIKASKLSVFFI